MGFPRWMYHRDYPQGKIFDSDDTEKLEKEGWVQSPADLKRRPGRPPKVKKDGAFNS